MNRFQSLALLWIAVVVCASAQTYEVSPYASWARISKAALGSSSPENPQDKDTLLHNGYSYGLRLTLNTKGYYGHEFSYGQTRSTITTAIQPTADAAKQTLKDRVKIHDISYNFLIYFMPRGEWWRPYMTAGLEAHQMAGPNLEGWRGIATRNYGINYGFGIKIRMFPHALVRLDLRDHFSGKPYNLEFQDQSVGSGLLRHQEASLGIAIGFR